MKKLTLISFVMAGVFLTACSTTSVVKAEKEKSIKPLRVGVYDSRCVAVAYVHSTFSKSEIQKLYDIVHKAEKEGDTKTAQDTREFVEYMQKKRHSQGFGTAPVQEMLEPLEKQLAQVGEQTGVDIIISKWQIDYQIKDAEFVDVTDAIVTLYQPSEKTLKTVEALKKYKPVSEEKILKIKD